MKRLTRIKLVNWHYFENETVDVTGSFLISGENAAGKSTLLDAIQLVLTTSTRHFNPAANEKSKRDLRGYVRCKTGEEGNAYHRKGSIISFVALEFFEEEKSRFFTIGVKMDSVDEESDVTRHWFCEEGPLDGLSFIVENKPALNDQFKNNGRKIPLIHVTKEARARFKRRLGNLDDKFFDMIPKSLAFKPMDDVKSFINKFILDENPIDVDTLRENIRNLRELQQLLETIREQIRSLEQILVCSTELDKLNREVRVIDILLHISELEECKQKLVRVMEAHERNEQELQTTQARLKTDLASYEQLEEQLKETEFAVRNNANAQLLEKLKSDRRQVERELGAAQEQLKVLHNQLAAAKNALKHAKNIPAELTPESVKSLGEAKTPHEERNKIILLLQKTLKENEQSLAEERAALAVEVSAKKERLIVVERELESLEKNKIVYPAKVLSLKGAIQEEFEKRKIDGTVRVLSDMLEFADENVPDLLRDLCEQYLGDERFALIVEPRHYGVAKEVYDRVRGMIDSVKVIDAGSIPEDVTAAEGSLAGVLSSENQFARMFVAHRLGTLIVCETAADMKGSERAISKTGFVYENGTLVKLNPELSRKPYIGKQAVARQLELMRNEHEELLTACRVMEMRIKEIGTALAKMEGCVLPLIQANAMAPDACADARGRIARLDAELKEVERDPTIIELQIKADELKRKKSAMTIEINDARTRVARLQIAIDDGMRETETLNGVVAERERMLEELVHGHENVRAEALKLFDANARKKSAAEIARNYGPRRSTLLNQRQSKFGELTAMQAKYKAGELGVGEEVLPAYSNEYEQLSKHDLIRYEDKLRTARANCELEFRESFLTRLRENIERARDVFHVLNRALKSIYYGNDSYKFHLTSNKLKQGLYQMIMSDVNVGDGTLFASTFEEKYRNEMEDLFAKLTASDAQGEGILREYIDYRSYLDYDIEIVSKDGRTQFFSKTFREKSGGETQTPYYVAIAASFSQIYAGNDTIRIIMLDEAFDKMDDDRIASMLEFFKSQNFQVILATPPAKVEVVGEYVSTILMVHRDGYSSIVEEYAYEEI